MSNSSFQEMIMKKLLATAFGLFLFVQLGSALPTSAETLPGNRIATLGGIQFSCNLVSHGTSPANIEVTILNNTTTLKAVRYKPVVTGTLGTVEPEALFGRQNVRSGLNYSHEFQTFGGSSIRKPEYPVSCTITEVSVCPMTPPKGIGTSYYDPFRSSTCLRSDSFPSVTFKSSKVQNSCKAIVMSPVSTDKYGSIEVYAIGSDPSSKDAALEQAYQAVAQKGGTVEWAKNSPLVQSCDFAHGAVAGSPKTYNGGAMTNGVTSILSNDIFEEYGTSLADSKSDAAQKALTSCHENYQT